MTYIHHVPRLAAAYDAALTQALTSMTRLTRMRYILGCTPTDALLAPLAAAGGLQVLVVEAWLQQEAVSRRQVPWRDGECGCVRVCGCAGVWCCMKVCGYVGAWVWTWGGGSTYCVLLGQRPQQCLHPSSSTRPPSHIPSWLVHARCC
jgi:hypothetical protein